MKSNVKYSSAKVNIGISEENLEAVVNELSVLLADEYILYTKTRNAHWNVEGVDFYDKHKLFEDQYEQLSEIVDNVAERIRSLGAYSPGSLNDFLNLKTLSEEEFMNHSSRTYLHALLADHESIIQDIREKIVLIADSYRDLGTSDFITGILESHEKMAWMLRVHLKA